MKLIVIRNTEAPSNVKYIVGGRCEEDLTTKGIEQAEELREQLKKYNYDVMISSPVKRAYQTAEIVNYKKIPIIIDERITERNPGKMLLKDRNLVSKSKWNSLEELVTDEGAETLLALINRTGSLIKELKEKYNEKTVVIVTHNSISRAIWMINNNKEINGNANNSIEEINAYYHNSNTIQIYENY